MGFLETLTVVFIALKVADVIEWSWWAVFSPMLVGYAVIFFGAMLISIVSHIRDRRRD